MKEYSFYGWQQADIPAINQDFTGINSPCDLYDALSDIWCAETCSPRLRHMWSSEDITLGQSSVTSFLAQDIFGGKVCGMLQKDGSYHCYNVVGDRVFDLTGGHFRGQDLNYEDNPEQFREVHFAVQEKRERYELLRNRLLKKLEDKTLRWEEVKREHVVEDEWIDFRRSAYRLPDGTVWEPYYTFSRRDYVVIVASDQEGKFLCVRQFRQGIGEVTTEFPAGGIERTDGRDYRSAKKEQISAEEALENAKRELREETGYETDEWEHLLTIPSCATIADNYAYVYRAKNCRPVTKQSLDEMEFLNVRFLEEREIDALIHGGDFLQAVHVMAWLLAKEKST